MLRWIGRLLLLVLVAAGGVAAYAMTLPDSFRIERSAVIAAPPEKIFPLIDNFSNWAVWSPWEKLDPAMKRTMSGPAAGVGAVYEWSGNSDVGSGRMEITESTPSSKIAINLDFAAPMEAKNLATFTLAPDGTGTRVTWAMEGPNPYIAKLFSLVFDIDALVGGDFEKGLAAMKTAAEAPAG